MLSGAGVPGTIVPLSVTTGAMLGPEAASIIVAGGAAAGSQVLFLATRHTLWERTQKRLGERLKRVEHAFQRGGLWYVLGLRVLGTPGVMLTSACALLPVSGGKFALATFVGLLPAALIASLVGAAALQG